MNMGIKIIKKLVREAMTRRAPNIIMIG
jgi:hypothetical protein